MFGLTCSMSVTQFGHNDKYCPFIVRIVFFPVRCKKPAMTMNSRVQNELVNMNQYTLQQTQTRYAISEEKLSVAEIINASSHVSISHSITLNC